MSCSACFFATGPWLEHYFRVAEQFGADSGDVTIKRVSIECVRHVVS